MRQTQKSQPHRSTTPSKIMAKRPQLLVLEMNNAIYQGDTVHFKREGFGTILMDDGSYFVGLFHRDSMCGPGVLFFPYSFLYSDFNKGVMQGPTILKNREMIWCGVLRNSKPVQSAFLYNQNTETWHHQEESQHCAWPEVPSFVDPKLVVLLRKVMSFDFGFLRQGQPSPAYDNFGILWPPPMINGVYEWSSNRESKDHLQPVNTLVHRDDMVYLGYVTLKEGSNEGPKILSPHGLGFYVNHKTMKGQFSGLFHRGWIEGLGRQLVEDVVEGCHRRSQLHGLGVKYSRENDDYVFGVFEKDELIEQKLVGTGYPYSLVQSMSRKIHEQSINYMNQTLTWKKFIGIEPKDLFASFSQPNQRRASNKENTVEHRYLKKSGASFTIESKLVRSSSYRVEINERKPSMKQTMRESKSFHQLIYRSQYKLPGQLQRYYEECIPEEYVIHSINNRMNSYDEFRHMIVRCSLKGFSPTYSWFHSENDYQIQMEIEEDDPNTLSPEPRIHQPLEGVPNQLSNLKHLQESLILSQLFRDTYVDSPKFNNSAIRSMMDSQLKPVRNFDRLPGPTPETQNQYKYDYSWQRESRQQDSSHQRKRIFDGTPPRTPPRKRIFD